VSVPAVWVAVSAAADPALAEAGPAEAEAAALAGQLAGAAVPALIQDEPGTGLAGAPALSLDEAAEAGAAAAARALLGCQAELAAAWFPALPLGASAASTLALLRVSVHRYLPAFPAPSVAGRRHEYVRPRARLAGVWERQFERPAVGRSVVVGRHRPSRADARPADVDD